MTRNYGKPCQLLIVQIMLLCLPIQEAWTQPVGDSFRDKRKVLIQSQTDNGLNHITFATVNGNVIAILPAEIAPADNFWGTVTLNPAGQAEQERRNNFNVLKNLLVQIKPENGTPAMMAPGCSPQVVRVPNSCSEIQISLYDPSDKSLHTYSLSCLADIPNKNRDGKVAMPEVAVPKRYFSCGANTDGAPGNAACSIGGENCPAVAGNPRNQWFAAPRDIPDGQAPVRFYLPDKGQVAESQISVVRPKIIADKLLKVGDRGQIKITLEGLKPGMNAQLIFRNLSPEIVSVGGGDYQVIPVSGNR